MGGLLPEAFLVFFLKTIFLGVAQSEGMEGLLIWGRITALASTLSSVCALESMSVRQGELKFCTVLFLFSGLSKAKPKELNRVSLTVHGVKETNTASRNTNCCTFLICGSVLAIIGIGKDRLFNLGFGACLGL